MELQRNILSVKTTQNTTASQQGYNTSTPHQEGHVLVLCMLQSGFKSHTNKAGDR